MSLKADLMMDRLSARFDKLVDNEFPLETTDWRLREEFLEECWDALEEHLYMEMMKRMRNRGKFTPVGNDGR